MSTEIQWTDETWNPVTGCSKVSPGCAHCYAEGVANRFWHKQYPDGVPTGRHDAGGNAPEMPRQFTDVWTHDDRLNQPLRWKKPRKVFVNSMSDLFHEAVPDAFIDRVFAVMALAPQHTFQILTKRAERMRDYLLTLTGSVERMDDLEAEIVGGAEAIERDELTEPALAALQQWPLKNVWLGVSVENQHFADERTPLLLQTPAAVRFISAEPLLGPVSLRWLAAWDGMATKPRSETETVTTDHLDGARLIDWLIAGCESGRDRRNQDTYAAHARALRDQCAEAGVAFFHKQMPIAGRVSGDIAEFPADLQIRQFPR